VVTGSGTHAFAQARVCYSGDQVAVARLCEKTALTIARTQGFSAAMAWTSRGRKVLAGAAAGRDAQRQDALLLAACALLRYRQGRYAEAEQVIRPAERVLRASVTLSETAFVTSTLGRTLARAGKTEAGRRLLEVARKNYLKAGERNEVVATEIGIAEALVLAGQPAEALSRTGGLAGSAFARPGRADRLALGRTAWQGSARAGSRRRMPGTAGWSHPGSMPGARSRIRPR
jgi:hypothetical protein